MSGLVLRDYQREGIDKTRAAHVRGVRRPAGVLPTGTGKTVVFAGLINEDSRAPRANRLYGDRALILAHTDELIEQAYEKVRDVAPHLRVGIVKANVNEPRADVVVGSVQTLRNPGRLAQLQGVGLVVVDECHHATAPSYRTILDYLGAFAPPGDPGTQVLGVTATMMRSDAAALGDIWEEIVFQRSISEMIGRGFLVHPHGKRVVVEALDLDKVKMTAGDFAKEDLGRALEGSPAPQAVARAYREECPDLPGILFAPTVRTAELFAEALREAGFVVAVVTGKTPKLERRAIVAAFKAGDIQILSNCGVFTEGTDLPRAQVCVVARPTKSPGLYVQMIGRVLRPAPGKDYALVLDVTGVSQRHSLVSTVSLDGERPERRKLDSPESDVASELIDFLDMPADPGVQETAETEDDPGWIDGKIAIREIDLFAGSGIRWGHTYAGVWFLGTPGRYLVVVPGVEPTTWDVAWLDREKQGVSGWIIRGQRDQGYAMGYAEGALADSERAHVRKHTRRRRFEPATWAQKTLIERWGGVIPEGLTLSQAMDMIDQARASKRIDAPLPDYARR